MMLCGEKVELSPECLSRIDPEIRSVLVELNANGYHTAMSCAGHRDPNAAKVSRGWILFAEPWAQQGIVAVLARHNLTGIRIGFAPNAPTDLVAVFDPIGQPRDLYDLRVGDVYDALDDDNDYPEGNSQPQP